MATTTQTATYKGKTYRLLWTGATKFGKRAKLAFMDGSSEFWVDASAVSVSGASAPAKYTPKASRSNRMRTCSRCGGNEANQVECMDCAY